MTHKKFSFNKLRDDRNRGKMSASQRNIFVYIPLSIITISLMLFGLDLGTSSAEFFNAPVNENSQIASLMTGSGVITVTKSVDWNGNTVNSGQQFTVDIVGPNNYSSTQTVTDGNDITFSGLENGAYTITEVSPGAGWVATYTVNSVDSTTSGIVTLGTVPTSVAAAPISGTVFRDFDSDGINDATDVGQADVTVTAYGLDGLACGSVQSGATGAYAFTPSCVGPWRIEFTTLPNGTYPSQIGADNGTSMQRVVTSGATGIDFALNAPCDYCETNPGVVLPAYVAGARGNSATVPALLRFNYSGGGASTKIADFGDTGSLYGVAHDPESDLVYVSAFLKRHVDLGPSGGGAIYTIDQTQPSNAATSLLIDLDAQAGISTGVTFARDLAAPGSPSVDEFAFDNVGKWGLGDLEIDADNQKLYAVNLFEKKLVKVDIATQTVDGNFTIGNPGCATAAEVRPFGLGIRDGTVYVGIVCDTTLNGFVVALQANGTFNTVLSNIPMNIGMPDRFSGANRTWSAWTNVYPAAAANAAFRDTYPTPILADIDFTADGTMLLSFRDRFGDQTGEAQTKPASAAATVDEYVWGHSQILQACKTAVGWTTGGGCNVGLINTRVGENASNIGGLATSYVTGSFITAVADPTAVLEQGSARWNFGSADEIAGSPFAAVTGAAGPAGFAKGNGLGDIELLCDPAPIEVGNRVWDDKNGNGVQDGDEPGLNGVQVTLEQAGQPDQTTTTSGDGNYSFDVDSKTPYTITSAIPAGYELTIPNSGSITSNDPITDVRDSDALLVSNVPTILYTSGRAGHNNHGLSFGFTQPATGQVDIENKAPDPVQIGNQLWIEDDTDGDVSTGTTTPVTNTVVTAVDGNGTTYTATTDANGFYTITVPSNATYTVTVPTPPGTMPSGTLIDTDNNPATDNGKSHDPAGTNVSVTTVDNLTIDFGFKEVFNNVLIGNRVFIESDDDGSATTGTITPVVGSVVTAVDMIGTVYTGTTDASGLYTISVPASAMYTVTVAAPAGTVVSVPTGGLLATDSNPATDNDKAHDPAGTKVTVTTANNYTIDFGFHREVEIGNQVWIESDDDGLATTGTTTSVVGSVVTAVGMNGKTYTATTDAAGLYTITVPANSMYTVTVGTPAGTVVSVPTGGLLTTDSNPATDNDKAHDPAGTKVTVTTVDNLTIDFGFHREVEIGNRVWIESDDDGLATTGTTTPVVGSVVTAVGMNGKTYTATTDAAGLYTITVPANSMYTVTVGTPAGTVVSVPTGGLLTTDSNPATDNDKAHDPAGTKVTVTTVDNLTIDFGFHREVKIGNQVWIESDDDGLAATNFSAAVDGVVVTAVSTGGRVYTATTDVTGFYTITVLANDMYTVSVGTPAGTVPSVPAGGVISTDADPNSNNQTSHNPAGTKVTVGTVDNLTIDFGFHREVEIGNQVWIESDDDGLATTGTTTPVVGSVVTAVGPTGKIYTATTDATGFYTITVLANAMYTVSVGTPAGTVVSVPAGGLISTDANPNSDNQTSHNPAGTKVTVGTINNYTIDFGFHREVNIGNQVWIESDTDGLATTGTITPVVNSLVLAVNMAGKTYSTTTDASGFYTLTVPADNMYTVTVGVPTGMVVSTPVGGLVTADSDPNTDNQKAHDPSGTKVTVARVDNLTIDFGFHPIPIPPSGVITVTKSVDWNSNTPVGTQEFVFTIIGPSGYISNTTVVDGASAVFTGLENGTYTVTEVSPGVDWTVGYTPTNGVVELAGAGSPTASVTINNKAPFPNVKIGNQVFIESDTDGDGSTGTLTPAESVRVTAVDMNGTVYSTTTNANGMYTLTVPANAVYTVTVETPANTAVSVPNGGLISLDSDPNGNNQIGHNPAGTKVTVGLVDNLTIDFAFHKVVKIGDQVWLENDGDGLATTGTVDPIVGRTVTGVGMDGTIYTAVTDASGFYTLTVPANGMYTVTVNAPAGVAPSVPTGGLISTDADPNSNNQTSHNPAGTKVTVGTVDNLTIDFGFYEEVLIGNRVWIESDNDGDVTTGTITPVPGALVSATAPDGKVYTAITDINGVYTISVPSNQSYTVTVGNPTETIPSVPVGGQISADNNPATQNNLSHNPRGTLVSVTGVNNFTIDFGFFRPVAVGNVVFIDDGAGGGTQLNGKLDGAEVTVPNVVVELYHATDTPGTDAPYLTTQTNASGEYLFDLIPEGKYIVHVPAREFVFGRPLRSFVSSPANGGDDTIDDNGNENGIDSLDPAMTGISSVVIDLAVGGETILEFGRGTYPGTLPNNSANMTVDFGFFELLTLGNQIWFDSNNNGKFDSGEASVGPNIVLYLLDGDQNSMLHPITGQPISTITTGQGIYYFTHLVPGDYRIQIGPENFIGGGPLEGYTSSSGAVDPDDNNDSDDNGNDTGDLLNRGIISNAITLAYRTEPGDNNTGNANANFSVDFGLVLNPTAVELLSFSVKRVGNDGVEIDWETGSEIDNFGFRLLRSRDGDLANAVEIHFEDSAVTTGPGAAYGYLDSDLEPATYTYWLVDVETSGTETLHGPVTVTLIDGWRIYLPVVTAP